jgi:hypothetical protein
MRRGLHLRRHALLYYIAGLWGQRGSTSHAFNSLNLFAFLPFFGPLRQARLRPKNALSETYLKRIAAVGAAFQRFVVGARKGRWEGHGKPFLVTWTN